MNYKTLIFGIALVLMAMLVLPAAACPPQEPTCPPGEVWGQTGEHCYQVPAVYGSCQNCPSHTERQCEQIPFWQANDFHNLGDCVSHYVHSHHKTQNEAEQTCKAMVEGNCHDVTVYTCHSEGYVSCDGAHHEKRIITPAHQQCDPIFGCIAVSCPAIPCPTGQHCSDGQCIADTCPNDFQCGEGQVCVDGGCQGCPESQHVCENECVPDVCGVDFQCDVDQECGSDNTCVPIPEQSSGPAYFSNPYWDQIGGCDRALYEAVPTGSLPTTGNGDIVVKAISCIIDARGDKYGCTALDGMKLFYRANDDGVFLPTCGKRCYFGGCDSVTAMGGYPLTATARNPQQELRAVVCKPYGDTYDVFTIQVTFEKPGMETVTMSTKDSCFDQTLGIGAYCGGCRASQALAAIFNPAWIAPADSPLWDTCRA
jgi:hypothetical protein